MACAFLNATAYAEVIAQVFKVECDPRASYFSWRSLGSYSVAPTDPFGNFHLGAMPANKNLAAAGFQDSPGAYCPFVRVGAKGDEVVMVSVISEEWVEAFAAPQVAEGDPFVPDEFNAELSVSGERILALEPFTFGPSSVEQLVEIAGVQGRHCVIEHRRPRNYSINQTTEGVSRSVKQNMSCRFFSLPLVEYAESTEKGS